MKSYKYMWKNILRIQYNKKSYGALKLAKMNCIEKIHYHYHSNRSSWLRRLRNLLYYEVFEGLQIGNVMVLRVFGKFLSVPEMF